MKKYFLICISIATALLSACSTVCRDKQTESKFEYTALFLKVIDGDTFEVLYHGEKEIIRLADVDCFEITERDRLKSQAQRQHIGTKQALKKGNEAKEKLAKLLMRNNLLIIVPGERDRYGRIVAYVYTKDLNVNQYMYYEASCNAFPDTYHTVNFTPNKGEK